MLTAANGSFRDNVIVREVDDTYIFLKNRTVQLIHATDFIGFDRTIKENQNKNIIIDGRMDDVLYYSILSHKDNILIYNVGEKRVSTIYTYLANIYKIPLSALTLNKIRQWAMIMFINNTVLHRILKLHSSEVLKYLVSNNCTGNTLTFNRVIDNINETSNGIVNKRLLKDIHDYMLSVVAQFNNGNYIIEPIKQKLLNAYHIRMVLEVLYSNRFVINL